MKTLKVKGDILPKILTMKQALFIAFLLYTTNLLAVDYYWVGGTGNWSDLTHWATTSGGSEYHESLPGSEDAVIFDELSFPSNGQTVTLDLDPIEIGRLDGTNVVNNPTLEGVNFGDELIVRGDVYLPATFQRNLKTLTLGASDGGTHVFMSGELHMGSSSFVDVDTDGEYHLLDELDVNFLYISNGDFYTDNYDMNIRLNLAVFANGSGFVDLGTSHMSTRILELSDVDDLDPSEATITFINPGFLQNQGLFQGLGLHYHHVIFNDLVKVYDSNSYDIFEAQPGSVIELQSGTTQDAESFNLIGTGAQNISIRSIDSGVQASLSQGSGSVDAEYVVLQDNAAIGGAIFTANFAIDLGNNTGWNIIENQPADYFWVGGNGVWTDLSHWATTSGGTEFHTDLPGQLDRVFLDQNSFSVAGEALTVNVDLSIKDLIINGVMPNTGLSVEDTGIQLFLYGNLEITPGAEIELAVIHMSGEQSHTISANGVYTGGASEFRFESGGSYSLLSDFAPDRFNLSSGTFLSEGHGIVVTEVFETGGDEPFTIDLSTSLVEVLSWRPYSSAGSYFLEGSTITPLTEFNGEGLNYGTIILGDVEPIDFNGDAEIMSLIVQAGAEVVFESGTEIETEELNIEGEELNRVNLQSDQPGLEWTFRQSGGVASANYMDVQDNHAEGGAQFDAFFSDLGSNVIGWNDVTSVEMIGFENINVYPNPSNGQVRITSQQRIELIEIYDLQGKMVKQLNPSQWSVAVDLSHLDQGTYILKTTNELAATSVQRLAIR